MASSCVSPRRWPLETRRGLTQSCAAPDGCVFFLHYRYTGRAKILAKEESRNCPPSVAALFVYLWLKSQTQILCAPSVQSDAD